MNWVRNVRADGEEELGVGNRTERVGAVELTQEQATEFFAGVIGPYVRSLRIGSVLLGSLGASDILEDPAGAARHRPVFELHSKEA